MFRFHFDGNKLLLYFAVGFFFLFALAIQLTPYILIGGLVIGLGIIGIKFLGDREQDKEATIDFTGINREIDSNKRALESRRERLMTQFGDGAVVERILEKNVEQGDTPEFVREALGRPNAVDQEVLKEKSREVWKYKKGDERRADQYNVQIKFEDGKVVGWEIR